MASTPPQTLRFHLLHSDETQGMVAKFYYPKNQRYDVYVDGMPSPGISIPSEKKQRKIYLEKKV